MSQDNIKNSAPDGASTDNTAAEIDSGTPFLAYLLELRDIGVAGSDDIVGLVLPLLEQVVATHDHNQVAPLNGVDDLRVSMGHLWYANSDAGEPASNSEAVRILESNQPQRKIDVTSEVRIEESSDSGVVTRQDSRVAEREAEDRVAYYPDYIAWEQRVDQHDALSDTFVLGMVMGSLATGLDLSQQSELEEFVAARLDLCAINSRLSPVIAQLIERMTRLSRGERPQDLRSVAAALANYRYQELEDRIDPAVADSETATRRQLLLNRLQNRLFEISRRNRLLYYRESGSTANLTVGSVPHVLDVDSIRLQQLLFTNEDFCKNLTTEKGLPLERWLRFEDYPFLATSLDRIRLQANRDAREYGFSQLRLVTAFLRWHNLKDAPNERINSPLILVPATITKRKGVRDSFMLKVDAQDAEINPALRHHLGELYSIRLPERIDASSFAELRALSESLQRQLHASDKGIELELVEQPRIQLIKRKAMRRLDRYRRKARKTGRGLKSYRGLSYSYSGQRYEPLGVQIFARDVRPANAPQRDLVETNSQPRIIENMVEVAKPDNSPSAEREFYSIDSGEAKGSTHWEIDLCSVSLANFSYRKMTLVRDYTELGADTEGEQVNFERLFSEDVRPAFEPLNMPVPAERYSVLPTDPSQQTAVVRARDGGSYVIQGPPGTGKSQTITNLIVDYVARGKSVLFVCEKRAALDVVSHRLSQVGLAEACCLIHDTREDKKPFIASLKARYEAAVANPPDAALTERRQAWLDELAKELTRLDDFSAAMTQSADAEQLPLRQIIGSWVERGSQAIELDARLRSQLPDWQAFDRVRELSTPLRDTLERQGFNGVLARAPARFLRLDLAQQNDHLQFIESGVARALTAMSSAEAIETAVRTALPDQPHNWADLLELTSFSNRLVPLAEASSLSALDVDAPENRKIRKASDKFLQQQTTFAEAKAAASGWAEIDNPETTDAITDDIDELLAAARDKEGKFFAFLNGSWRKAKALVKTRYSGDAESVREALALLQKHHNSRQKLQESSDKLRSALRLDDDVDLADCSALLYQVWDSADELTPLQRDLLRLATTNPQAGRSVLQLARGQSLLRQANLELESLLAGYSNTEFEALRSYLEQLQQAVDSCDDYVDDLAALQELPDAAVTALRQIDLPFDALEAAVLEETIRNRLRNNRSTSRFSATDLDASLDKLATLGAQGHDLNGEWAMHTCANKFHQHLTRASEPMTNTSAEEKDWRRAYTRGRKMLEREFEKTRAYRSVRELFAAESGEVLRDLRPVWLMSPLSVADALPLAESLFDVVIFDEASQIPLEDAIPTVNRATQMIVVGDEMQLPPTRFFSGKGNAADDDDDNASEPDVVQFDLNADSFLTRAGAALPGTLLAWHYRSKHESLIGFCNRAFYAGALKTIPTPGALQPRPELTADLASELAEFNELPEEAPKESAEESATINPATPDYSLDRNDLLARPISYHRLHNSPYQSQRNPGEALYIAQLVRQLLLGDDVTSRPTIGIVAFSQAQQNEIESALNQLASTDNSFRTALDLEEEREEDDQFVGLFVKNLENVQGDERDIIILSVCYAPNASGRMIMNFGPINQNGGHKRLNVIFSRAKQNMMVVSSIDPEQITNTYNEGANALRQYLRYASAVSTGDQDGMLAALTEYGEAVTALDSSTSARALQEQVGSALVERGYRVASNYGQSDLRCHLAVGRAGSTAFELAILFDDSTHYAIADTHQRYTSDSSVLRAFGWNVAYVLGKDWYQDRTATVDRLVAQLEKTG